MTMVGRNRPCPCGSGKKYKLCCGVDEVRRHRARARRRSRLPGTERELRAYLVQRLLRFADAALSDGELAAARRRFLGPDMSRAVDVEGALGGGEHEFFVEIPFHEWLLHDYASPQGETVIGRYLERGDEPVPRRVRAHLEYSAATVASVYEVRRVVPGYGLELTDLIRGGDVSVRERSGSRALVRWDIVLTRVIELDRRNVLSGAILQIPRRGARDLLDLLEREYETFRDARPDATRDEFLKAHGDLAWRWAIARRVEPPPLPELTTFDGEPVMFCRAEYRIRDEAAMREALAEHPELELVRSDGDDGDHFTWYGAPPDDAPDRRMPAGISLATHSEDGRIARGWVTFDGTELAVETQSEARFARLRALVEEAAGPLVEHRGDTVEDPLEAMGRQNAEGRYGDDAGDRDPIPPAIQAEVAARMLEGHYRKWLDEEIPALDGETPRRAVRTAAGKARVLEMVKDIEHQAERDRREGRSSWDPGWLREELGLEEA